MDGEQNLNLFSNTRKKFRGIGLSHQVFACNKTTNLILCITTPRYLKGNDRYNQVWGWR